jgi:hypothetical protein
MMAPMFGATRLARSRALLAAYADAFIALIKTLVSNSTFDHGSLSATYVKPFDVFAKGSKTGDWLAALDDFRNWLIREAA